MKTNKIKFDFEKSLTRIDTILNDSETVYEESDVIPDVDSLTLKKGKYVKCAAFFIDLRGSSDLIRETGKKSRTLAKIYRAYISEIIAILNSFDTCREVNIVGDCVSAVFSGYNSDRKESYNVQAAEAASMANAMMDVLNTKYNKKFNNISEIKAGIGLSSGRALVTKAGLSGSGISELIYMGDVVNMASKMCSLANKEGSSSIYATEKFLSSTGIGTYIANSDTKQTFKDFFIEKSHPKYNIVYTGNFHRIYMNDWVTKYK